MILAAIAAAVTFVAGCAGWRLERLDLNRFRDQRAQDIDSRLSKAAPSVQNPFSTADAP